MRNPFTVIAAAFVMVPLLSGQAAGQKKGGTLNAVAKASAPAPRTAGGKPDLSGLWDHPFVIDMSMDGRGDGCGAAMKGCSQKGPGGPLMKDIPGGDTRELPFTEWGLNWFKRYDATEYDSSAHCNPLGYMRSMNSPVPTQIVQRPEELVFLHEAFFAFHVVYLDGRRHPAEDEALETTWYGHSVGHWEGDTMVVDTVGPFFESPKMILDTRGHGVSGKLHIIERFTRPDTGHLNYEVTVDDPKAFTRPWKNTRTWILMPKGEEILEYVCTENNKEVNEGLIKNNIPKQ
jgi:hypothetical protein